jgi:prolyl oligopeptidase
MTTDPSSPANATTPPSMPFTARVPVVDVVHGIPIEDPYRWLEDQDSPKTRAWIDEQNRHTDAFLVAWPGKEKLDRRLTELMRVDTVGMPIVREGLTFFMRRKADEQQGVIYLRRGLEGDEVLVDPHALSLDYTTSVTILDVSEDGRLMVYGVREGGADEIVPRVMDLRSRTELADSLPCGRYFGVSITPERTGLYYSIHTAEGTRIRHHKFGQPVTEDVELFGAGYGPEKIIGLDLSEDGRWLVIVVYHGSAAEKTEVYLHDTSTRSTITVVNDINARFYPQVGGDQLYLQTDWQAPTGRILAVPLNSPGRENWHEVVTTTGAIIEALSVVGGKLFVNYLDNVQARIAVHRPDGTGEGDIELPGIGSVSGVAGRWSSEEVFYTFTSFTAPPVIFRYEVGTGKQTEWARSEVPVDTESFAVEQVWYKSKDGTPVPMFLVHHRSLPRDGARPVYLTGYGGFSSAMTPYFSALATLLAESGGIFAMPALRGGGEFGEEWHRAGMREKKQNVFDDFIAAAEWLIHNGYTNPSKIAIGGGSNGGLLVGAALTQRPELFRAVVCGMPLLDMIRYHQFLVAGFWVPEYGSSEDPEQFNYLLEYSPYHNVKPGVRYPAVLFMTGDSDTRVAPLHARKMAALLQSATGSDRPILLHYDTKAGHSAGLPLNKQIEDATILASFVFQQLEIHDS